MDLSAIKSDESLIRAVLEQAGVEKWTGAGRRQCRCPFHDDKHPSAGIYQARGSSTWLFQCNGCATGGDVIRLIAITRKVSDGDVLRHLSETGELLGGIRVSDMRQSRQRARHIEPPYRKIADEVELYELSANREWLGVQADDLGVTVEAMELYRAGRHEFAMEDHVLPCLTLPMYDEKNRICGIRYRATGEAGEYAGQKRARLGSWGGLFQPMYRQNESVVLWVVEGCTDPMALASLGLWCVGLPGARQSLDKLDAYIERHRPEAVISVSDSNAVGKASATMAANIALGHPVRAVKTVPPPEGAKDVRAWVKGRRAEGADWQEIRAELLYHVSAVRPVRGKHEAR